MVNYSFWNAFRESVIMSGFVCVVIIGSICYLAVTQQPIPDVLVNIALTVVGFLFGAKSNIKPLSQ